MFIARHGLWTAEQQARAGELAASVGRAGLRLVRLAWADPHGCSRAKALSVPAFVEALASGYNINVATTTLDSAGGRVFRSFTAGGGMGLAEMTGSPNLVVVPDPATFRILPWAPGVGWVLCDEYFRDGTPFHFSPRHLLRKQLARLAQRGLRMKVGIEIEWYLLRLAATELSAENVARPGLRGRPLPVTPVEPGYSYHSETNMDLMQPVLDALADAYAALELPWRSLEKEWGPGQVECTLSAQEALRAADDAVLLRTATRQVCRRLGYMASFMCRPAIDGFFSSGWHLHQSLTRDGKNVFTPTEGKDVLSCDGRTYLAGLLANAAASTVFAAPTVNGYRRFRPNSLAPDRAAWGYDHRGAMVRALGGAGDPATRLENRVGEPGANPYLYIASQLAAGLDGMERELQPPPQDDAPYSAERPRLPGSLAQALDALEGDRVFRAQFGDVFIDYYVKLKRSELARFEDFLKERNPEGAGERPTEWEQNEYLDFF